jgi:cell division GTPase FtsZ
VALRSLHESPDATSRLVAAMFGLHRAGVLELTSTMRSTGQLDGQLHAPRIVVTGIGGGGCNAINHMIGGDTRGVDFVAVNTDSRVVGARRKSTVRSCT